MHENERNASRVTIRLKNYNPWMSKLGGIVFPSDDEALAFLYKLQEVADRGWLSVNDVLDMLGDIPSIPEGDKHGWDFCGCAPIEEPTRWPVRKISYCHWQIQFPMVERIS